MVDWLISIIQDSRFAPQDYIDLTPQSFKILPICILGKSSKPNIEDLTNSMAMLLASVLEERHINFEHFDPYVEAAMEINYDSINPYEPKLYVIMSQHSCFKDYIFPIGSIVIDFFDYIPKNEGIKVLRLKVYEKD